MTAYLHDTIDTGPDYIHILVPTVPGYTYEDMCWALAEGEHAMGPEATRAGASILQWPGTDCPWGHARATP